jgi:hypothetical protein
MCSIRLERYNTKMSLHNLLLGGLLVFTVNGCADLAPPCENAWYVPSPVPVDCPVAPAERSSAAYMQFEYGQMIWVETRNSILVLYNSETQPRWQEFDDVFEDGAPEYNPALNVDQPAYAYQPRRGMGLIWRENDEVRSRLGWAVAEYEFPFSTIVQQAANGTLLLNARASGFYVLLPQGRDWMLYDQP